MAINLLYMSEFVCVVVAINERVKDLLDDDSHARLLKQRHPQQRLQKLLWERVGHGHRLVLGRHLVGLKTYCKVRLVFQIRSTVN